MKVSVRAFFLTLWITAAILCTGECLVLHFLHPNAGHYGAYLLFLFAASFLAAFAVSFLVRFCTSAQAAEHRAMKAKIGELERELEHLTDAAGKREEFIASFAHELKTPLTAIIGYADMLRSREMTPKNRFTAAGYIFSEGRRLETLSLKLMDIIVAGKQEFERKSVDAGYLIREVAAVAVPSTGNDGISLAIRWDPAEVMVEHDLFKTLLINLVDNARKASSKGQNIELFGKREEDGYAFYVRDQGRGMKPEELSRITEPFYMIDKSRSRAMGGAGLGLALCQRIAELHHTTLDYTSTPGEGTTVRVFLKGGDVN